MKIKKILVERLGVPEGILDTAEDIYPKILSSTGDNDTVSMLKDSSIEINGDFNINDFKFNKILVSYKIYKNDKLVIVGMSQTSISELTDKFQIKTLPNDGTVILKIVIAGPESINGSNVKELLEDNKELVISSLSHELKHAYDEYKFDSESVLTRANYNVYTNKRFDIKPIDSFLQRLYFISSIENLVRPTEVASLLKMGNVTKKGFYDFIKNNRTYSLLTEIVNFDLEKWKDEIKEYIPEIVQFFNNLGVENIDVLDEDEIVDEFLKICYINIVNWTSEEIHDMFVTSPIEALVGFIPEKDKIFTNHLNKVHKFGHDYQKFYEYEAKKMKYVANNLRKKIAKLYDMTNDEKNESIKPKKVIRLSEQDLISLLKGVLDNPLLKMIGGEYSDRYGKKEKTDDVDKLQNKTTSDDEFYKQILKCVGAEPTKDNMSFMYVWRQAEGGKASFNPFNTTKSVPNATNYNSANVKNYKTMEDGVKATCDTLKLGYYTDIVNGLKKDIGLYELSRLGGLKKWGTGELVAKVADGYLEGSTQKPSPINTNVA
jgi:hypothetical protein